MSDHHSCQQKGRKGTSCRANIYWQSPIKVIARHTGDGQRWYHLGSRTLSSCSPINISRKARRRFIKFLVADLRVAVADDRALERGDCNLYWGIVLFIMKIPKQNCIHVPRARSARCAMVRQQSTWNMQEGGADASRVRMHAPCTYAPVFVKTGSWPI